MRAWLDKLGYNPVDPDRLNIIHVAGTKGKGSTYNYVNGVLMQSRDTYGFPRKIGLYTSPHIRSVRERIHINSQPISETAFAKYFFDVWDRLQGNGEKEMPPYFRFLTPVAFHAFMSEQVDAAVVEVGVGGEFDPTNVISTPAAVGIINIHLDHQRQLGDDVGAIAWHKAGIIKPCVPTYTVQQVLQVHNEILEHTGGKGVTVRVVTMAPCLSHISLESDIECQKENASLAIPVISEITTENGLFVPANFSEDPIFNLPKKGLERTKMPGRGHTMKRHNCSWCLDGAHMKESLELLVAWFGKKLVLGDEELPETYRNPTCVLIFNQQARAVGPLLQAIQTTFSQCEGRRFDTAIFCTDLADANVLDKPDFVNHNVDRAVVERLDQQHLSAMEWQRPEPETEVKVIASVEDVVDHIDKISLRVQECNILVTGSFHLVDSLRGSGEAV
ncbi:putative dihydrofolate synthase [Polychaeton citri CBS 116435]|uniref:tetrahydrofolate synthase n=1 Tax=Polychaeton citri CBS 116435 TaxID=1314669 RepID=A0A9P4UUF0_9PEZI|nr:putative dihydrofolate synthase [Polychaeton citri CBS 116435]